MHLIFGAFLLLFLGFSCQTPHPQDKRLTHSKPIDAKNGNPRKSNTVLVPVTTEHLVSDAYYRYEGQVGGRGAVAILFIGNTEVSGRYFYERNGRPIDLFGQRTKNDSVYLQEYCIENETSGTLEGLIHNDGVFSGNWVSEDRSRKTPFVFHRRKVSGLTTQVMVYNREMVVDAKERSKGHDKGTAKANSQFRATIPTLNTSTPSIGKKINAIMASKLDAMIKAEMMMGDDFSSLWHTVKQSKKEVGLDAYELVIYSYVSYMDEHIICLGISYWQNAADLAHPWDSSQEFIFDLKTGTLITLESLLKSEGKKSLNLIGQKAIQKLFNHPAIEGKDFELTDNFTVNPYGLLFVYRRGEIGGSYADAPFDVFIPYSDLKQLLKSETILSNYLKNLKNA